MTGYAKHNNSGWRIRSAQGVGGGDWPSTPPAAPTARNAVFERKPGEPFALQGFAGLPPLQ